MSGKKAKVLIIEDDVWFADSLISGLKDFEVGFANDPDNVFSEIEKNKPDVIVADIVLGSKNLFTLLNEMQSYVDTRSIPVIILSSQAKQINLVDVESLFVKAVIDKTEVTPELINREIAALVDKDGEMT